MTAKDRPRFNVEALRTVAGNKVFARGEEYHRDGSVEILAVEPGRVLAEVSGTDDYRTVLKGHGTAIDGECSCPAFEDWGFCKHMVAVALSANERGADDVPENAGALARIRKFLKAKGADALVEMVVDIAERDSALFHRLDVAAATLHADDKTLEARMRRAIDSATRTRGFVSYHEAGGWAAGVDEALDALADLAGNGRADMARKLADHAMDRIEEAIESIDDSEGHGSALLHRAGEIHLAACREAKPDPVAFAHDLFEREMNDGYDTFYGAAALYADVLGEPGLAEYRRLATEAWERLPMQIGRSEFSGNNFRLKKMLDFFAERDGNVQARIDIRAKDLSSPWKYLQLAEFCLSQVREEEALRRAEEGLWVFEDGAPDERLVFFAAELLQKAGRKEDAEGQLWRAFEKVPSHHLYRRLRKLGGKRARERVIALLEGRLAQDKPTRWYAPADLLISVLIDEKMLGAAWSTVRQHRVSADIKLSLAKASEASNPEAAVGIYAEHVEQLVSRGGSAYKEAAKLISHVATLRNEVDHAAYVADLKTRHRRKRNFMKLLG